MEVTTNSIEEEYLQLPILTDEIVAGTDEELIEEAGERFKREHPDGSSLEFLEYLPEDTMILRGWNYGTDRGISEDWTFIPHVAMGFSALRNKGIRRTVSLTTAGKMAKFVRSAIRIVDPEENETPENHVFVDVRGMQIKEFVSKRLKFRNAGLSLEKSDYRITKS